MKITSVINSLGFHNSKADNSLFFRFANGSHIVLLIYIDDILVIGSNDQEIQELIMRLNQAFALKDLGKVSHFLRINVTHTASGIHLNQDKYI